MVDKKFRKALDAYCEEREITVKILDDHAYDKSVVGITDDGRLIYSRESMTDEYMRDEDCSEEEANEWIDYNTMRALPYIGEGAPIIMDIPKDSLMIFYK